MLINNTINCEVKQSNLKTSLYTYDKNLPDNTSLNLLNTNNIKPETISTVANVILDCVDAKTKKIITYKPQYGRPGLNLYNVLCFVIFMSLFEFNTVRRSAQLLNHSDKFKLAMGIPSNTPVSEYTISKLTKKLYNLLDIEAAFITYYMRNKNNNIIFCSAIDSTIYEAKEKSKDEKTWKQYIKAQQQQSEAAKNTTKKKRGRPRKGSPEELNAKINKAEQKIKELSELIKALQNDHEGLIEDFNFDSGWTANNSDWRFVYDLLVVNL